MMAGPGDGSLLPRRVPTGGPAHLLPVAGSRHHELRPRGEVVVHRQSNAYQDLARLVKQAMSAIGPSASAPSFGAAWRLTPARLDGVQKVVQPV